MRLGKGGTARPHFSRCTESTRHLPDDSSGSAWPAPQNTPFVHSLSLIYIHTCMHTHTYMQTYYAHTHTHKQPPGRQLGECLACAPQDTNTGYFLGAPGTLKGWRFLMGEVPLSSDSLCLSFHPSLPLGSPPPPPAPPLLVLLRSLQLSTSPVYTGLPPRHIRTLSPAITCQLPGDSSGSAWPAPRREMGIQLLNNQRQHRTLHIQQDVLPYALC